MVSKSNKKIRVMTRENQFRGKVSRPKYARDKKLEMGMKLYSEEGKITARKRAPKGGGYLIGCIVETHDNVDFVDFILGT